MSLPRKYSLQEVIACRIREFADENGFSYAELAQITGVPKSTITSFMSKTNRNLKIETIAKLANGFDMTVREFFDDDRFDMVDIEELINIRGNRH